jgi:heme-degrading monooxygenase HmoA
MLTKLPQPPYYAVIFTSLRSAGEACAYQDAAQRMVALAAQQPGFLGVEAARGDDGLGITVSYWASEAAILAWRENAEHSATRRQGRERWYEHFATRVCKVERSYASASPAFDLRPCAGEPPQ